MQTLLEATEKNIDSIVVNPGTHYFHVMSHDVARVRTRIYNAIERQGNGEVHTSYNRRTRTLRVVVSL